MQMKRLGAVAAGAMLAGLLLHQVFATASANAADSGREAQTAQAAVEQARAAEATAQAAAAGAAKLAEDGGAGSGIPPAPPVPPAAPGGHAQRNGGIPAKEIMALSIPIVAIVMGIGIGMLAIWTEHKRRVALMELCHKERMAALEKGLEPPPFPQEQSESVEAPKTGLKGGLIWLALGIGLGLFLGLQPKPEFHPALSAIPIALGLAYLIYYGIEGRKHSPTGK